MNVADARLKSIPPPQKVETPEEKKAPSEARQPSSWYERASAAATDLHVPTEPIARVLWAAEQIRIEFIILAGNSGRLGDRVTPWATMSSRKLATHLTDSGALPREVADATVPFLEVRNRVAHGKNVSSELIDAADSTGLSLVSSLRATPREWIRVVRSNVPIYSDRARTLQHSTGIVLVQIDDDGTILHQTAFPCDTAIPRGSFVSWEWDDSRSSDQEGWYEDPRTGELHLAWSESFFFSGRPYPDQWGLMDRVPRPDVGLDE